MIRKLFRSLTGLGPALVLALAAALISFDVTAVVIALTPIARDLRFDPALGVWVMDAYSIAFTGALIAAGGMADRFGARRALIGGLAGFALASIACGLAWSGPAIWAARAGQGLAAAFVITGALALIAAHYTDAALRARAFAVSGVISGTAMAFGPALGGAATATIGWPWLFLVNLPVCAVIAVAARAWLPEHRVSAPRPFDPFGAALVTATLAAAAFALLGGGGQGWPPAALASGAAALLVWRQLRHPVLPLDLLRLPGVAAQAVVLLSLSFGYWSVLVHLPRLIEGRLGLGADDAGLAMTLATLPMLILPAPAARIFLRLGAGRFFAAGLGLIAAGDGVLAWAALAGDGPAALAGMAAIGSGAGLVNAQASGAFVAQAPPDRIGAASALSTVMRQGGFAIGIAALAALSEPSAACAAEAAAAGLGAVVALRSAGSAGLIGRRV